LDNNYQNILILAPHTDDGEFGCGASISKFVELGKNIIYVAFSTAEESVPEGMPKNILEVEVREATQTLGIPQSNLIIFKYEVRKLNYVRQELLEELIKIRSSIKPDVVFVPSVDDIHQDHSTISIEGMRAFKNVSILGYEIPWNNFIFKTQSFIKVGEKHLQKKIQALKAYKSQHHRPYASEEFIRSWAITRGTQINTKYAEAFEVIRWIIE
jgi:LmbE family N-acetylglucosaminyl deacetylase